MTVTGEWTPAVPRVPQSAWMLGWACLAGQVAALVERGLTNAGSAALSVPLTALVVAWVSYGVLRARTVRLWFAAVILLLTTLLSLVGLVLDVSLLGLVDVVTGAASVVALLLYTRSDCFARFREDPRGPGPALGGLVAIAVVVGMLGGLASASGAGEQPPGVHVRVGL